MLWYHDDLRKAHVLKESFYEIMRMTSRKEQRKSLVVFIKEAEKSGLKKFVTLANTYRNRRGGILNALSFPYSNGVTEGFHNKIKVLKRISYRLKNFEEYRKRNLFVCN